MDRPYDIVVIGAGPAGLAVAIEAQKAGLSYLVIDKGGIVDGIARYKRDMYFFSTPELLEIGGMPFIVPATRPTSLDCVNYYRAVAEHFGLALRFFERITSVDRGGGIFRLASAGGTTYEARNLVIATGYYDHPNPINVPGEQLPHVSHYYSDPHPFYRQRVVVVGGKNSAVEAALDLWRHGAHVTLIHRGEKLSSGVKYWILPDFENRVAAGAITAHYSSTVREFCPGRTIIGTRGNTVEVPTDFAFILTGYLPDVRFLRGAGINVDPDSLAPQFDPATMETNVPGLYVAGGLVGGRFNNKVFIENGRGHGKLIVAAVAARGA